MAEVNADIVLHLSDDAIGAKVVSLKAMPSQTSGMFDNQGEEWFKKVFCCETFVDADRTDTVWNTRFLNQP